MGWEVIALGIVEIYPKSDIEVISNLLSYVDYVTSSEVTEDGKSIILEMSGNRGIDYEPLEITLNEFKSKYDVSISCSLSEYSETGNHFEYGDDE